MFVIAGGSAIATSPDRQQNLESLLANIKTDKNLNSTLDSYLNSPDKTTKEAVALAVCERYTSVDLEPEIKVQIAQRAKQILLALPEKIDQIPIPLLCMAGMEILGEEGAHSEKYVLINDNIGRAFGIAYPGNAGLDFTALSSLYQPLGGAAELGNETVDSAMQGLTKIYSTLSAEGKALLREQVLQIVPLYGENLPQAI